MIAMWLVDAYMLSPFHACNKIRCGIGAVFIPETRLK